MKLKYLYIGFMTVISLTACVDVSMTHVVKPVVETNQTETQSLSGANVTGWVSFAEYVPAYNSVLTVTLYMEYEGRHLPVGEQIYNNSRLPVRYSFAVAPIQSGQGPMHIKAELRVDGKLKAKASLDYFYRNGLSKFDLILKRDEH